MDLEILLDRATVNICIVWKMMKTRFLLIKAENKIEEKADAEEACKVIQELLVFMEGLADDGDRTAREHHHDTEMRD